LEMTDFTKGKETWQLNEFTDKFDYALARKTSGNVFFEKNDVELAMQKYKKSLDVFSYDSNLKDDEKDKVNKQIKLPVHLNMAACFAKMNDLPKVIENATKALELDSKNVKALWRRGAAKTDMGDWMDAKRDLNDALQMDPNNKTVKNALVKLKQVMENQDKKDKARYKNMFQRLSELEKTEKKEDKEEKKDESKSTGGSDTSSTTSSTHDVSSSDDSKKAASSPAAEPPQPSST